MEWAFYFIKCLIVCFGKIFFISSIPQDRLIYNPAGILNKFNILYISSISNNNIEIQFYDFLKCLISLNLNFQDLY